MEDNKIMTDEELEAVVNAASEAVSEDVNDIRNVDVEVNENAELEVGTVSDDSLVSEVIEPKTSNISLFDIGEDKPEAAEADITAATDTIKENFDLSDEDVLKLIDIFKNIDDKYYHVYYNLPTKMKDAVTTLMVENKLDPKAAETISRTIIKEVMTEAGINNALIDLEKAIDEALNIPSIIDMYSEHTRNVMENLIPETIEKIKDDFPDKAERLAAVKDAFTKSYNFEVCKEAYVANARLRKAVRRFDMEFNRTLDKFNYINEKSSFKMNDVRLVPEALRKVLIEDLDKSLSVIENDISELDPINRAIYMADVSESDIKKFCVLIFKYCENMDPCDLIDATFMYYLMRNIIMLKHGNESKTEFAAELINNICAVITFIRDKEAEFNESNMDKSKHAKRSANKRGLQQ